MSVSCGRSSAKTPHSRTRRAISCEYWPPKSSTRTSSCATARSSASSSTGWSAATAEPAPAVCRSVCDKRHRSAARRHPDLLLALELLALRLQRRGHHQLGPVELRDVLVAAGRHRGPQRAHQVERAVVLAGGTGDDLLQRAVLRRAH